MTPLLLIGAGRMGGALISGWRASGAVQPSDLLILDPSPGPEALAAADAGAVAKPTAEQIRAAPTVLLAVKPQVWRAAAEAYGDKLAPDAVIVSVLAGVRTADLRLAFGDRPVARVMPTTAVAIGRGAASVYAADPKARARARALFDPVAAAVDLPDEALMDAATAMSGSGPAYLYAFVEALEAAGRSAGLPAEAASTLARATVAGAAALMEQSGEDPAALRRQVTSPGGTTEAALDVLSGENGLAPLMRAAVSAAVRRSRELAG